MILFLLTQLAAAELHSIWLDRAIVDSERFPDQVKLGFLEQARGNELLFAIEDVDLVRLEEKGIPVVRYSESKNIPDGYRSTQDGIALMEEFTAAHPDRVRLHTLGFSRRGRPILGLQISDTVAPLNTWKLLGAHHGDELSSAEVSLDFIQNVYDNIDSPEVSEWLQANELWIVPHVNPDGIEEVSRYNESWVDLNRNYSWEWTAQEFLPGDYAFSEPETQAIRILEEWHSFTGGLSLHSGAANISWVWNYSVNPAADDTLVRMLAEDYAAHCAQPGFWVVNGGEWYITYGDTTDWAYGAQGSFDLTLEVSADKRPPHSQLEAISGYHIPAIWNFLQWEHWISAMVYDSETQQPIRAEWQLLEDGILDRGAASGRISRLVEAEGLWTVVVSAAGYESQVITIESGQSTDIYLESEHSLSMTCTLQSAGEVELSIAGAPAMVALYKQGTEILQLEQEESLWTGQSTALLSGIYDIKVDDDWYRNAVVLVDRWANQPVSAESQWMVTSGVLEESTTTSDDAECVFQISQGRIIGFANEVAEPAAEPAAELIEPAAEDPSTEPTVEPAEELALSAGGCQAAHVSEMEPLLWVGLLGCLGWRRQQCAHRKDPAP